MKYHTTPNPNLAVLVDDEGTTIAVVSTPNPNAEEVAQNLVEMQSLLAEWQVKVSKLERERDNYKRAYDEWTEKTEWVQQTAQSHELGMHRADVLKARIARAATQPVPRYKIGYQTDQWGEPSMTPVGIPDPTGDWVRYDDHAAALASAAQPAAVPHIWGYAVRNPKEPQCPTRVVESKDHADRVAIYLYESEIIPLADARLLAAAPKAAPAGPSQRWRERWHGSPTEQGWSIMHGRECVAYLGPDVSSEAVSAIVAAHNAAPTTHAAAAAQGDALDAARYRYLTLEMGSYCITDADENSGSVLKAGAADAAIDAARAAKEGEKHDQ